MVQYLQDRLHGDYISVDRQKNSVDSHDVGRAMHGATTVATRADVRREKTQCSPHMSHVVSTRDAHSNTLPDNVLPRSVRYNTERVRCRSSVTTRGIVNNKIC